MIPKFPKFKKLQLSDKKHVESFTQSFPPYSDFNFASLWHYNVNESIHISQHNDNLVLVFDEYVSDMSHISCVGSHKLIETFTDLLIYADEHKLDPAIRLVPEEMITISPDIKNVFDVTADRDNHDYILATEPFMQLKGRKYNAKRKNANKFTRTVDHSVVQLQLARKSVQNEILELFERWAIENKLNYEDVVQEKKALQRCLTYCKDLDEKAVGIRSDQTLIGFSIVTFDKSSEYAHNHFMKSMRNIKGLYEKLDQVTAEYVNSKGYPFMNIQQDMGQSGLRRSKLQCKPSHYLKKYSVALKK